MSEAAGRELDAFQRKLRSSGQLLGLSIDSESESITLFVPAGEPLSGLPHQLDGLRVIVVPLPRPQVLGNAS